VPNTTGAEQAGVQPMSQQTEASTMRSRVFSWQACTAIVIIGGIPGLAGATSLHVTASSPRTVVSPNGEYEIHAFSPTLEILAIDTDFSKAFQSWNASVNNTWTLKFGGDLGADTVYTISTYMPNVTDAGTGDLKIRIDYTAGTGAPAPIPPDTPTIPSDSAVWSQSILTSFKKPGTLPGNPYLDNDSPSGANLSPPAYPFQYAGSHFFDDPHREADASWFGVAYLSQANYTTDTLTVYDAVDYGFVIESIPEPTSLVLAGIGGSIVLLAWALARNAQCRQGEVGPAHPTLE
jgi:hypothetical protein